MPNIVVVDYEALPGQAEGIRNSGREFESHVKKAFSEIDGMRQSWFGQRYNKLVQNFNSIIDTMLEMQKLVITEIPSALEQVARNYEMVDKGSSSISPRDDTPTRVPDIAPSNEVGMRFLTGDVSAVQASVTSEFSAATDTINSIRSQFSAINWESEAHSAFEQKLTTLSTQIINNFDQLKQDFATLMNDTLSDMATTENANTVS